MQTGRKHIQLLRDPKQPQSLVSFLLRASRHSQATRLLISVMPASCYAKNEKSLDGLHQALSDEMTKLFYDGVSIQVARLYVYSICSCCFVCNKALNIGSRVSHKSGPLA